jgi:hypothetical protein
MNRRRIIYHFKDDVYVFDYECGQEGKVVDIVCEWARSDLLDFDNIAASIVARKVAETIGQLVDLS